MKPRLQGLPSAPQDDIWRILMTMTGVFIFFKGPKNQIYLPPKNQFINFAPLAFIKVRRAKANIISSMLTDNIGS